MRNDPTAKFLREVPRESQCVALDDDVKILAGQLQEQIAHEAADDKSLNILGVSFIRDCLKESFSRGGECL